MSFETIHLDDVDGFGFEQICERIFDKAGWGTVQQFGNVADKGRDLVIHPPQGGKIIVECKHQPNTSVGRPVVQKLHSAVVSFNANRGILVTTGRFTKEAVEHARELSKTTRMDLFDLHHLTEIAESAGIRLVTGAGNSSILYFPVSDTAKLKRMISGSLDMLYSHPKTAAELLRITPEELTFRAHYIVRADIDQDFSTSVGRIHSVHESNRFFLFNAGDGSLVDPQHAAFLANTSLSESLELPDMECHKAKSSFVLDVTSLRSTAIEQIIRMYTKKVTYVGRNKVTYSKTCEPGPRSIQINDISQVMIPTLSLSMQFLGNSYACLLIQNRNNVRMLSSDLHKCKLCREPASKAMLLCNSCGNISHPPKLFGHHGFVCSNCKKTICKSCTYWHRRLLFFKRILCEQCADAKPKSKKRLT